MDVLLLPNAEQGRCKFKGSENNYVWVNHWIVRRGFDSAEPACRLRGGWRLSQGVAVGYCGCLGFSHNRPLFAAGQNALPSMCICKCNMSNSLSLICSPKRFYQNNPLLAMHCQTA